MKRRLILNGPVSRHGKSKGRQSLATRGKPEVHGDWRLLYGDLSSQGVAMELHEYETAADLQWSDHLAAGSFCLCLNLTGVVEFVGEGRKVGAASSIWLRAKPGERLVRAARSRHHYILIQMNPEWLNDLLAGETAGVHSELKRALHAKSSSCLLRTEALGKWATHVVQGMDALGMTGPGRRLWMQAKLMEILAAELYPPAVQSTALSRSNLQARRHVHKAMAILAADLENPPALKVLARQVGCSPFYLSRAFSRDAGMTLSRYIRSRRMEKAAELLATGRYNVTETALEVGYSSLSHFSKAFAEHHGHCPCVFPLGGASAGTFPAATQQVKK